MRQEAAQVPECKIYRKNRWHTVRTGACVLDVLGPMARGSEKDKLQHLTVYGFSGLSTNTHGKGAAGDDYPGISSQSLCDCRKGGGVRTRVSMLKGEGFSAAHQIHVEKALHKVPNPGDT